MMPYVQVKELTKAESDEILRRLRVMVHRAARNEPDWGAD